MSRGRKANANARPPFAGRSALFGLVLGAFVAGACSAPDAPEQTADKEPTGDAIERTKQDGPLTAKVSLAPAKPRLGDRLTLTLTVEADPGVAVEMPGFGDALGRFAIVDFAPRQIPRDDGGTRHVQRYTLQSPGSGRQRIPPLRIEWTDQRGQRGQRARRGAAGAAATNAAASDDGKAAAPASATAANSDEQVRELLTDELALEVASVLPDEAEQTLRPAPGPLELPSTSLFVRAWPAFAIAGALALLIAAIVLWRRAARTRAQITAWDKAVGRLQVLERGGLPGPGEADLWYVELSSIVRRYLEDRFALRAPELTTQEFLREARRSRVLSAEHQATLSSFLALCDRVKFAGHEPDDSESQKALDVARRFIDDTRLQREENAAAAA